jgi:FkbM family methyltransferase
VLPILYQGVADQESLRSAARTALGQDAIGNVDDLRHVLGALDRQFFPSAVTVRFGPGDVVWCELDGFRIALDRADASVSAIVANARAYEPHVSAVLAQVCRKGWTVIDVGANIGYHSLGLSRLVGPQGRVLAVEANSENCRLLLASVEENEILNIELFPVALDADRGWSYFTTHVGSNGGLLSNSSPIFVEGGGWIVPTVRLDDIASDVDLIKIDVEGGEGRVVRGAEQTLRRCRPVVVSEFSCEMLRRISGVQPAEYLSVFTELDYDIGIIDRSVPGRVLPVPSAKVLLDSWGDDLRIEDLLLTPR